MHRIVIPCSGDVSKDDNGVMWGLQVWPSSAGVRETVYGFASVPNWRWTHGHVENVAAAIVKAALHPNARNAIINVGEEITPTMAERLALLPHRDGEPADPPPFDYSQPFVLDTGKIRAQLGYDDVVDENTAMRELAAA